MVGQSNDIGAEDYPAKEYIKNRILQAEEVLGKDNIDLNIIEDILSDSLVCGDGSEGEKIRKEFEQAIYKKGLINESTQPKRFLQELNRVIN